MKNLILYLFLLGTAYAQSADSLAHHYFGKARSYGAKAQRLENQGNYAEQAIMADSFFHYATAAFDEYDRLLETDQDSLYKMNLLQCYRLLIGYHSLSKAYDQAEVLIEQSFEKVKKTYSEPEKWLFMCHNIRAEYLEKRKRLKEAIKDYEKTIEIMETYQLFPALTLAYYYTVTGDLYRNTLDLDKSAVFQQQALRLRLGVLGPVHEYVSLNYHKLALAYDLARKSDLAIENYKKTEEIRLELFGDSHMIVGELYMDMGVFYWRESELDQAIDYFEKALKIFRKNLPENHIRIAGVLNNMGLVYDSRRDYPTAIRFYRESLKIRQAILPPNSTELVRAYDNMALSYFKSKNKREGLFYIQKAMNSLIPDFNPDSLKEIDFAQLSFAQKDALKRTLMHWGLILSNLGEPSSAELQQADQIQQVLINLVKTLLEEYRFEDARTLQQSWANMVYLSHLNTHFQLYQFEKDTSYFEHAYELYEKAKAFLLRKEVQEGNILQISGVPENLIQKLDLIKREKIFYEQETNQQSVQEVAARKEAVRLKSLALNRQYDSLINVIENTFPVYLKLKKEDPIIPLRQIQDRLNDEEVIIAFWDGLSYNLDLNVLVIHKSGMEIYKRKGGYELIQLLDHFKEDIAVADFSKNTFKDFCESSQRIYETLLKKPLQDLLDKNVNPAKITIITDGVVNNLPFELLLTHLPDTTATDYRNLPYVLQNYTINYAQSISLWYEQMQKNEPSNRSYAGFAPSYDYKQIASAEELKEFETFRSNPGKLQSIYEEVSFGQQLFGGDAYMRTEATEANFKQKLQDPAILHLAMHALADPDNPMQSRLIFTSGSEDEDDYLHAYEIYTMKLATQMAILSACETGVGKTRKGEGVYSLARAFTFAGCPSIVTSFWQVNDKYTSALMKPLFTHLHAGEGKAEALRKAKLEYLQTTDQVGTHPANWAAFVHLGNDQPVNLDGNVGIWKWLLLLIPGLILLFFIFFKKNPLKR